MQFSSFQRLFVLCILLALVHTGSSLDCYTCSSPSNGICGDDFSVTKVAALTCKSNEHICFKGSMTVLGVTVTTRACGTEDHCDLMEHCSTCKANLCNSTSSILPSFILMSMSIVGLIFTKFH